MNYVQQSEQLYVLFSSYKIILCTLLLLWVCLLLNITQWPLSSGIRKSELGITKKKYILYFKAKILDLSSQTHFLVLLFQCSLPVSQVTLQIQFQFPVCLSLYYMQFIHSFLLYMQLYNVAYCKDPHLRIRQHCPKSNKLYVCSTNFYGWQKKSLFLQYRSSSHQ